MLVLVALCSSAARAQAPQFDIVGRVIDGQSGAALAWSEVSLGTGCACARRSALVADSGGAFVFRQLAQGWYCVSAVRAGYAPLTVRVEVPGYLAIGLALELQPIALAEVHVDLRGPRTVAGWEHPGVGSPSTGGTLPGPRSPAWLAQDAVVVAPAASLVSAGLPGADVLRALRSLPGIDAADDFATRLWVRGADWSQTRIHFDGVPLFDPVHAAGIYSTLRGGNGHTILNASVQPVTGAAGAAATIDVNTAPATRDGGDAEVSLHGAAVSAAGRTGRMSAYIALRTAWLALLSDRTVRTAEDTISQFPFRFSDMTARADLVLSARTRLEASAHGAADELRGTEPILRAAGAHSSSTAARISLVRVLGTATASITAGASMYNGDLRWDAGPQPDTLAPDFRPPLTPQLQQNTAVRQLAVHVRSSAVVQWSAGASLEQHRFTYDGPVPVPAELGLHRSLGWMRIGSTQTRAAAWTDVAYPLPAGLRIASGARLSVTPGAPLVDPRLAVRWRRRARIALEVSAGRNHQLEQGVGWAGAQVGPRLESVLLVLPAAGPVPVVRGDVLSAAVDVRAGADAVLRMRTYLRSSTGNVTRTPRAGPLLLSTPYVGDTLGAGWTRARETARGLEIGVARRAPQHDIELGYTLASVTREADGVRYPAPSDRRHVGEATILVRATGSLGIEAHAEAGSGSAYTRFFADTCDADCPGAALGRVSAAGVGRTRSYQRLDLSATWAQRVGRGRLELGAGVINLLGHENTIIYTGSTDGPADRFAPGWPRSLTAFVRLAF